MTTTKSDQPPNTSTPQRPWWQKILLIVFFPLVIMVNPKVYFREFIETEDSGGPKDGTENSPQ
jgi:hypothetical protein